MKKDKKRNKRKRIPVLGKNATDREIIKWATRHDPFDRLDAGISTVAGNHSDLDKLLDEFLFQENSAQLNMRVPRAMRTLLTKLAKERTTEATTLARIWLAERIRAEISWKSKKGRK